eukprot:8648499-Alexandrium_andersonii.AAC.1
MSRSLAQTMPRLKRMWRKASMTRAASPSLMAAAPESGALQPRIALRKAALVTALSVCQWTPRTAQGGSTRLEYLGRSQRARRSSPA